MTLREQIIEELFELMGGTYPSGSVGAVCVNNAADRILALVEVETQRRIAEAVEAADDWHREELLP